ncbi:hypothetical protein Trydic_g4655 [Trypoxylus dichotomus]
MAGLRTVLYIRTLSEGSSSNHHRIEGSKHLTSAVEHAVNDASESPVVDGTRGVDCLPYAVGYALRDLAYCCFELDRAAYRCDRADMGGEVIRESSPRHRLARPRFLIFWCRLSKLQQQVY